MIFRTLKFSKVSYYIKHVRWYIKSHFDCIFTR